MTATLLIVQGIQLTVMAKESVMASTISPRDVSTALCQWVMNVSDHVCMAKKRSHLHPSVSVTHAIQTLAVKQSALPMELVPVPFASVRMATRESFVKSWTAQVSRIAVTKESVQGLRVSLSACVMAASLVMTVPLLSVLALHHATAMETAQSLSAALPLAVSVTTVSVAMSVKLVSLTSLDLGAIDVKQITLATTLTAASTVSTVMQTCQVAMCAFVTTVRSKVTGQVQAVISACWDGNPPLAQSVIQTLSVKAIAAFHV